MIQSPATFRERARVGADHERLRMERLALSKLEREILSDADQQTEAPQPVGADDRSKNVLRPKLLADVVGQANTKAILRRVIDSALAREETLDHALLIGSAGTGKTTLASVIANELGRDCYQLAAPVSIEQLLDLREVMQDGDILFIDEIHMQAVQERRGKEANSQPEVFLQLLEDHVLATNQGMLSFPNVTIIGATTDPGRLPDPFLDRFPLQPRLDDYTQADLELIAERNAASLNLTLMPGVAKSFAAASRGTPRIVNNYVRNSASLCGPDRYVVPAMAQEVLADLNGVTEDGLTTLMQKTLVFLYKHGRRELANGDIRYQASVSTIATDIGLSRDTKAVQLRVEPFLISSGYLGVASGGRMLTPKGVRRAQQLATEVQT